MRHPTVARQQAHQLYALVDVALKLSNPYTLCVAERHQITLDGCTMSKAGGWFLLAAENWYFTGNRPVREKPNPNFAALPPKGDLVGKRVKHFWSKMGRCAVPAPAIAECRCG